MDTVSFTLIKIASLYLNEKRNDILTEFAKKMDEFFQKWNINNLDTIR